MGSLGLCFLVLLAGPSRLAAQDSASRLFPVPADNDGPAPSAIASLTFPVYRLLPEESRDDEPWSASADLGTDAPLKLGLGPQQPTGTPLRSADALSSWASGRDLQIVDSALKKKLNSSGQLTALDTAVVAGLRLWARF